MYTENANKAIELQLMVNHQINKFDWAQEELVNELENVFDSLTDGEIDMVLEWYEKEKQGQEAILAQWDMA